MIGKVILQYRILQELGRGGMGIVYKAEEVTLGRAVALKFLPPHLSRDSEECARLEREAKAVAALDHPGICTIYGFFQSDECTFIAMEYVEGETLKQQIKRDGPLPEERAIQIVTAVAETLAVAHHKGIIHRDIKSDNIMLTPDGRVKVMDFGLAKMQDAPTITRSRSPLGTVSYMSPEQVEGKPYDQRTDLWSLGVVLYEMLTGRLPFERESDVATMRAILEEEPIYAPHGEARLNRTHQYIISKLLEKDTLHRYGSVEDLLVDLSQGIPLIRAKALLRAAGRHATKITVMLGIIIILLIVFREYSNYRKTPPWLRKNAKEQRVRAERGATRGRISPDGTHIIHTDSNLNLSVENLQTGERRVLQKDYDGTIHLPIWSPDGRAIAFISHSQNGITIVDTSGHERTVVTIKNEIIFGISWSPDGSSIAYVTTTTSGKDLKSSLGIITADGSKDSIIVRNEFPHNLLQMTWYVDSKRLAFIEYELPYGSAVIRTISLLENTTSLLTKLNCKTRHYQRGGLAYSTDGNYLLYPDDVDGFIELVALPVKENGSVQSGPAIPLTHLAGYGEPYWPHFYDDGKVLCYNVHLAGGDIELASIDVERGQLGNRISLRIPLKIPIEVACWSSDCSKIAYVTRESLNYDIFVWDRERNSRFRITDSKVKEEYINFLPDDLEVSFTAHGVLKKVSLYGSAEMTIIAAEEYNEDFVIYANVWGNSSTILYAIISSPSTKEDSGVLVEIDLASSSLDTLIENITHPFFAQLTYSQTNNYLAIRHAGNKGAVIEYLNLTSNNITPLVSHSGALPWGDISWTPDGQSIIYGAHVQEDKALFNIYTISVSDKIPVILSSVQLTLLKLPGRISPKGDEIVLFVTPSENESHMLGVK